MVKPIVKDVFLLQRKSVPATAADFPVARDLLDTLMANADRCVGMAANMIGVHKRIIVVSTGLLPLVMLNPRIVSHSTESYTAEEGCLSLTGTRTTQRWEEIEVAYQDTQMQTKQQTFSGFVAQIIQHEIDHCEGILI